jgi:hypothetical protein
MNSLPDWYVRWVNNPETMFNILTACAFVIAAAFFYVVRPNGKK